MKRFLPVGAALLLSAAAFYGVLRHAFRDNPPSGPAPSGAVTFALGGLLSPADITGGAAALQRLSAAHCGQDGAGFFPARPEEMSGVVPWERGTPVSVLRPGDESFRRDAVGGYWVACEGRSASLFVRVGRFSVPEMAGSLVLIGGGEPVLMRPGSMEIGEGRKIKAAFRVKNRTYAWTSPSDEVIELNVRR